MDSPPDRDSNPYRAPVSGGPPLAVGRGGPVGRGTPPTVIAAIVLVSLIEAGCLLFLLASWIQGTLFSGVTALTLVGLIRRRAWGRSLALVMAWLALAVAVLSVLGVAYGAVETDLRSPESPLVGSALLAGINLPIVILLMTASAKQHFGRAERRHELTVIQP